MQDIISSVGGPHVLLQKADLASWGGIRNIGGENAAGATQAIGSDYDRASKIQGYAGIIPVGSSQAISFWGDRLDIGVKVLFPGEILIVRIGTDFSEPFGFAESLAKNVSAYQEGGEFDISCSDMVIIDASEFGGELTRPMLKFSVMPGRYELLTYAYEPDD